MNQQPPYAVSMKLRETNEPESLAREQYDYLKKELEGMGYKAASNSEQRSIDDLLWINGSAMHGGCLNGKFAACPVVGYSNKNFGPLLDYNPALLLAIAAQKKEGATSPKVGCIYKRFSELVRVDKAEDLTWSGECLTGFDKGKLKWGGFSELRSLATIDELIAAFTKNGENSEPGWIKEVQNWKDNEAAFDADFEEKLKQPRKIRKGDRLVCNRTNHAWLVYEEYYTAVSDEFYFNDTGGMYVNVVNKGNEQSTAHISCFAIANDEPEGYKQGQGNTGYTQEPKAVEERLKINWDTTYHVFFPDHEGGGIGFNVSAKDGIEITHKTAWNSPGSQNNMQDVLRAVLEKYDELKAKQ